MDLSAQEEDHLKKYNEYVEKQEHVVARQIAKNLGGESNASTFWFNPGNQADAKEASPTDWSIYPGDTDLTSEESASNVQEYVDVFNKSFAGHKYFDKLDYSHKSLGYLDKMIDDLWEGGSPSDEGMVNCIKII